MKRILCAVGALMMCATPLFAVGAKDKEKTEFDRHWFMQVQAGAAYTLGETGFGDLLSPAAALSAGYRFSPVWGLRFGLGGWQAKGAWVSPEMHYKFNYLQGNVEAMLDLANLFGRFNPVRTVNPYLFAGVGVSGAFDNDEANAICDKGYAMENVWSGGKVFVAGRLGAGLNFRLSDCVLLGVEVNADMLSDKFNSKKAGNVDWQFNALAGLTFRFGKTYRKKAAAVPPAPVAPAAPAEPPVPKKPLSDKQKKAQLQQEVESAAQEVSDAIEQELAQGEETYRYPPITLLEQNRGGNYTEVGAELRNNSKRLADTLRSFGVDARAGEVIHGPSVTRYEFTLDQGVKLSKITNLQDDIALALGASGVRIAPVPNKISAVGIEVPNRTVTAVRIRDVIESREFIDHPSPVAFAVGRDIGGSNIVGNIARLPHVLIAGTTGSGKSVCTNSLIVSLLYKSTPDEVRFIMVDPKMVELAPYNGIPHLLIPVVTDPKKAAGALQWAVFEMMKRYKMFSEKGVKDLAGYNALSETDEDVKKLPTVVVVIDELADLMLVAAKEVEESICRVAQMGRAAGMHLVIATQRPSADVITGLMKANIPSRIAFAVASSMESRIILDTTGAEKLVGKGDMLYFPLGDAKPTRVQGCFITPEEIDRVVKFVKDEAGEAHYDQDVIEKIQQAVDAKADKGGKVPSGDVSDDGDDADELLSAAVEVVLETGQASVSMLQRRLKLGYSRAARLVDQMEERGYVGPFEGSKPRQLLITREKWQELQMAKGAAPAEADKPADRYGSIHDVFESHDALE